MSVKTERAFATIAEMVAVGGGLSSSHAGKRHEVPAGDLETLPILVWGGKADTRNRSSASADHVV